MLIRSCLNISIQTLTLFLIKLLAENKLVKPNVYYRNKKIKIEFVIRYQEFSKTLYSDFQR